MNTERPNGLLQERVLATAAAWLSRAKRPLWYMEQLVLSARYQQFIASSGWARDSVRYRDRFALWERAAEPLLRDTAATVLEFGVADGAATRWWAARGIPFAAWHGFDTFEGLPEEWVRGDMPVMPAGAFKPNGGIGTVPEIDVPYPTVWHRGLIEETLPGLDRPDTPLFVLIDVDLLGPTSVILDWLGEHGRHGDLVYFDEAFDPWNEGMSIRRAVAGGLSIRALAHSASALLVQLS